MPKIIENVRENILAETRKQLEESGYDSITMRDIASKCGIAVGTLYNYFPSKEDLTGHVVLEDWVAVFESIKSSVEHAQSLDEGLAGIYGSLGGFIDAHKPLFLSDLRNFKVDYQYIDRHSILLAQIEEQVRSLNARFGNSTGFTITFIAESILNSNVKGYPYSEVGPVLMKLMA